MDEPATPAKHALSGRLLARNTIWNLAAQGIPVLVALVAVRILIRGMGDERFGILMLAWTAIGYFSLFDLGLGRALTQAVSAALGARADDAHIGGISATTLVVMLLVGTAGGLILAAISPWLIHGFLNIPVALQHEALVAFLLMAASLPFVVMTAGLRGLLEAHQDFGVATLLRLPYAIFTFVAPVLILSWTNSVAVIVGVLVVGRIALWGGHVLACLRRYPYLRGARAGDYSAVARLLRLGGWMTVSNVISPIMVSLDRFLISALITVAAVTYYATPYEMVTKLLLVPGAVLGVMFPAFATAYAQQSPRISRLVDGSVRIVLFLTFPVAFVLVVFAPEILGLWVGKDFPEQSAGVMRVLMLGVFLNGPGQVGFAGLQAIGRADLAAKLHALELPLYLAAIWVLATTFGLEGAAIAWTARVAFDTIAMCALLWRHVPESGDVLKRGLAQLGGLSALLAVGFIPGAVVPRLAAGAAIVLAFGGLVWRFGLRDGERALISGFRRPAT